MNTNIFEKLQQLDRRWIYLILAITVIIPLIFPYNSRTYTTPSTESLYRMIDSFAPPPGVDPVEHDRAFLMVFSHDASTMPELFPMELAVLRHAFERNIKVFMLCFMPTAAPIIDFAINTMKEHFPHIQSGVHYANFGFKPGALMLPIALGMGEDIAEHIDIDSEGRKVSSLPIMTNIRNYNEMNLVIEFSGSAAGGLWIMYARPRFGVNVAVGVTAVTAADLFPLLQTGQLIGMLGGLKGAAEYEHLVDLFASQQREFIPDIARRERDLGAIRNPDVPYVFKQARIGMNAQSVAHLLIIVFILIGNIGYFAQKYQKSKEVQ